MKHIFILITLAWLLSCNNTQEKTGINQEVVADSIALEPTPAAYNPESALYVWKSSPDYTIAKNPALRTEMLNIDSLILGLNQLNENVFLEKLKLSGDTVYTEIKDSKYLAEQMGTTGAEMYLADVVLNLTEVPGIRYVHIQMQEGSHMQPGLWSKENFSKYKPVN